MDFVVGCLELVSKQSVPCADPLIPHGILVLRHM
jgi:hypothetical protein